MKLLLTLICTLWCLSLTGQAIAQAAPAPVVVPPAVAPTADAPNPALQNPLMLGNDRIYQASLAALTKFFVVAVLLESGLSLIFNSTLFLALFNRRTMKPVVMFVVSFLLVSAFKLDLLAQLIAVYNSETATSDIVSKVISALILAGGSAGVFNIMVSLGFRSEPEGDSAPQLPSADHAWVSVRLANFKKATDNVKINIEKIAPPAENPPMATAGTILAKPNGVRQLITPIKGRFPPVAGYSVEANQCYKIQVMVKVPVTDANPTGEKDLLNGTGIYKFAPRAIVDLEVPYTAGV